MQTLSSAPDPAVSVAVSILAVLLALTGFGLWTAFGPKAAKLTDPWMIMMINSKVFQNFPKIQKVNLLP
jgi:PsbN protein